MSYRIRYIRLEAVLVKVNRFGRQYKTVVLVSPCHGHRCNIPNKNKEPRIYQIRLYHQTAEEKNKYNITAHQS
jgi:hypothetical protein